MVGDLVINGDGANGLDGQDGYGYKSQAAPGQHGQNGGNATMSTDGENAKTIHLTLERPHELSASNPRASDSFIANIHKHNEPCKEILPHSPKTERFVHRLSSNGRILLSACGGTGGNGGSGGNGQRGGNGRDGIDATKESHGTNGENGGAGGDAGAGSSGGNGGRGGDIKIFIKEEDMDLLVAVPSPNVTGGQGGTAGENGNPGKGGYGGRGGIPHVWQENRSPQSVGQGRKNSISQYNPGGRNGFDGPDGSFPETALTNGVSNPSGSVQIFIQRPDRQLVGPFSSTYQLEIDDFDIVDSNEDEIFEFGETLTLRNISVKNTGGMPSPKSTITIQGISTPWLIAPEMALTMPPSIPGGSTAAISGNLVFQVQRPDENPQGDPFIVHGNFQFQGHMEKMGRDLPNFHTPRDITLRHPIEMSKPKYLRSLEAGQRTMLSWTVQNVSSKPLGSESASGRVIKVVVVSSRQLNLNTSPSNRVHHVEIPIGLLESRQTANLEIGIMAHLFAGPYERMQARLMLYFTPFDYSQPCLIQDYELPMQVANTYRHDPEAEILLVTNCRTSSDEVDAWEVLICDRLRMKMDVWNVSLSGRFELEGGFDAPTQSLFQLYKGRTIIVSGNSFPYFELGYRTALDLIGSTDFAPAMLGGTSIFVSAVERFDKALAHAPRLLQPSSYPHSQKCTTVRELVMTITLAQGDRTFYETRFICLPSQRGPNADRCAEKAKRASQELSRRLPSLRFVITWTAAEALGGNVQNIAGKIEVLPCVPYDTGRFLLTCPTPQRSEDVNEFCVLLSVPFSVRLQMLWLELERPEPLHRYLIGAIEFDIIMEITRFIGVRPPWPDCIPQGDIFSHLKRLSNFFLYEANRRFSGSSITRIVTLFGNLILLADCCSGSWPRVLTFGTRRKALCAELDNMIDMFLTRHYDYLDSNTAQGQLKEYVAAQTKILKSEPLSGRRQKVLQRFVMGLGIGIARISQVADVFDVEMMGNIVRKDTRFDNAHAARLAQDLEHAREEVQSMSPHESIFGYSP